MMVATSNGNMGRGRDHRQLAFCSHYATMRTFKGGLASSMSCGT